MKDLRINWLIDADSTPLEISHTQENPLIRHAPLSSEAVGQGFNESARIDSGIYLFHARFRFTQHHPAQIIHLADIDGELPEQAFMARVAENGSCLQYERTPETIVACEPGLDLFRHAKSFSFLAAANTSSDLDITSLCVYRSKMECLLGENITVQLLHALNIESPPSIVSRNMPRHLSVPLRQAMNNPYQGKLRLVAAQAKILDYLSGLAAFALQTETALSAHPHRRTLMEELYEELISLEGKLPPITELAHRYKISSRTLNEEFKKNYGASIITFVMNHRLKAAHEALLHSDIAIKTLADRLGYSHVNHFTNAFSKKFGYPPGKLRIKTR